MYARLLVAAVFCTWLLAVAISHAQQPTGLSAAVALEQAMVETIAKCEKSVVAIARGPRGSRHRLLDPEFIPTEFATGVVIGREGYIVTAYHVLGDTDANVYAVWVDGQAHLVDQKDPRQGKIVGADSTYDLAVLKINADSLTPMPLGDAKDLKKGQIVIALGNPLAIARDGEPSATWGIVSNLHRKAAPRLDGDGGADQKETLHHYGTLIQTDARLERGTSGGALINLNGEMVGLTTRAAALPGSEKAAGFAIPVDESFLKKIQDLKLGKKIAYGFLGVAPDDAASGDDDDEGVKIVNVVHGTPAASAELRVGDRITHVGDAPLRTAGDLILEVARHSAGETVPIRFVRHGNAITRDVKLSKKYVRSDRPDIATAPAPSWRGLTVDFTTAHPRFVELSHDADTAGCVVVTDVEPDSPAWRAGLRSGIFISHIGGRRVSTPDEFYRAANTYRGAARLQPSSQFDRLDPIVVQPM